MILSVFLLYNSKTNIINIILLIFERNLNRISPQNIEICYAVQIQLIGLQCIWYYNKEFYFYYVCFTTQTENKFSDKSLSFYIFMYLNYFFHCSIFQSNDNRSKTS